MIIQDKSVLDVRDATEKDIDVLANEMSAENVKEIFVAHHITPRQAISMAVKDSVVSLVVLHEGRPVGIFGIINPKVDKAEIYFLVTNDFVKIGRVFLKYARNFIDYFLGQYKILDGYVFNENVKSITWMKYCGAVIEEPEPWGIEGKMFSHFYFTKDI